MNEFEALRQRKIQQLQEQQAQKKQVQQVEDAVKRYFTPDALERYSNIKTAHPETAFQVMVVIAQLVQSGQLNHMINDEMLKKVLQQLTSKREINIIRK